MRDGLEEVILSRNGLPGIEEGKLSARGVPDLERALIEVTRAGPETIGARPITCTVDAVTPHTLRKVDALARLDHLGRGLRGQFALLEPFRHVFGSDQRNADASRRQDNSEGGDCDHSCLPT
jgi:hypothetical protein